MTAEHVLLVEDDDSLRAVFRRMLEKSGYQVEEASTVRAAQQAVHEVALDAAVLDYRLSDGTALDLLPHLHQSGPRIPAVILTGHGSIDLAVRALQAGADHFLTKPLDLDVLSTIVARLIESGRDERRRLAQESRQVSHGLDPFLGTSTEIGRLGAQARRLMGAGTTILIRGETGVGKGVLAAWIHHHGSRRDDPFVDVNCSVLSRELVESELFGHRKGAFTGAVRDKPGLLEVAHHGTVFLDEIGDLDIQVQPKLLKALEDRRIRRVGDVTERPVDVRLMAATHQDLARAVDEGRFREDLFYRVNTVQLFVPPLRERREDIPLLARHLLDRLAGELGRLSVRFDPTCVDALCSYSWPGNIRELKNVIERAVILAEGDVLHPKDLRFGDDRRAGNSPPTDSLSLASMERRHIELVLRLASGNVAEAARRLDVPRSSLYEKIARHRIDVSEIRT